MAPKHYDNIRVGTLNQYITADMLRTILPSQRNIPLGVTEIPVEIQLKKESAKELSFLVPWDGMLYGCVRGKKELRSKLGLEHDIISIAVSDWDDNFALIFLTENPKDEAAFYINRQEVIDLLENCIRVPEQYNQVKKG